MNITNGNSIDTKIMAKNIEKQRHKVVPKTLF